MNMVNEKFMRYLKIGVMFLTATLMITFSFLLAYKLTMSIYPFDSTQELVLDFLKYPKVFELDLMIKNASFEEISHLKDVAEITGFLDIILFPQLILTILLLNIALLFDTKTLKSIFKLAGTGGLVISVTIGLFSSIFFNTAFEIFHVLLFPQGNYSFPGESFLMQTFLGGDVFFQIALLIFLITILINFVYLLCSYLIKGKPKKKPKNRD